MYSILVTSSLRYRYPNKSDTGVRLPECFEYSAIIAEDFNLSIFNFFFFQNSTKSACTCRAVDAGTLPIASPEGALSSHIPIVAPPSSPPPPLRLLPRPLTCHVGSQSQSSQSQPASSGGEPPGSLPQPLLGPASCGGEDDNDGGGGDGGLF